RKHSAEWRTYVANTMRDSKGKYPTCGFRNQVGTLVRLNWPHVPLLYESLQEHIRRSTHFVTETLIELAGVGPACLGGKRHRVAILGPGELLYPLHKQATDAQVAQRDIDY